jgi:hypothetical protein
MPGAASAALDGDGDGSRWQMRVGHDLSRVTSVMICHG